MCISRAHQRISEVSFIVKDNCENFLFSIYLFITLSPFFTSYNATGCRILNKYSNRRSIYFAFFCVPFRIVVQQIRGKISITNQENFAFSYLNHNELHYIYFLVASARAPIYSMYKRTYIPWLTATANTLKSSNFL